MVLLMTWSNCATDEGILTIGLRDRLEWCCLMTWSSRENDEGILARSES